jgi:hypothetical protein
MHCHDAALAQSKADREWCGEMTRLNDLRGQERDAALTRAEAAEKCADSETAAADDWASRYKQATAHALVAESRLVEATALLRMWHANVVVPGTLARLEAFLSAAPAPAVTAEPEDPGAAEARRWADQELGNG